MIDVLKAQLKPDMPAEIKLHRTRETLQLMALKIIYDKGWFNNLLFVGGTALRFLYDLRRFSEDLDFSLFDKDGYDFTKIVGQLSKEFQLNGLSVDPVIKKKSTVHGVFLKFQGLLKELGISPLKDQKLSINFEVDTNPPQGSIIQKTMVNKIYLFQMTHPDLPSSYATKLHACFYRTYVKGRDFYDFIWYLGKRIKPNYELLNNAITQTQKSNPGLNEGNIKDFLLEKMGSIDLTQATKDVERFLEDKDELKFIDVETIKGSILTVF